MAAARTAGSPFAATGAGAGGNLPDQFQKLHQLHQSGALSSAEFEAAKHKLLAGGEARTPTPPPTQVVHQVQAPPGKGCSGCFLPMFGLLLLFGVLFVTNPDEQAHRDAISKQNWAFNFGSAMGAALGAKYHYNNYLVFSTMSVTGLDGVERHLSTGFLTKIYYSPPTLPK